MLETLIDWFHKRSRDTSKNIFRINGIYKNFWRQLRVRSEELAHKSTLKRNQSNSLLPWHIPAKVNRSVKCHVKMNVLACLKVSKPLNMELGLFEFYAASAEISTKHLLPHNKAKVFSLI